jgi:hypothetical protein
MAEQQSGAWVRNSKGEIVGAEVDGRYRNVRMSEADRKASAVKGKS